MTDHTPATPEQLAILTGEIALAVAKAKPSAATVQYLLSNKVLKRKAISAALKALEIDRVIDPRLAHSQKLWAKLGMPLYILDDLVMPDIPADWRGCVVIPPISNKALFALCAKHFPSWKYYENLNDFKEEQYRPKCTYVVGHRGGVEPDQEHRNKSYEAAINEGLIFLTQKERICIELIHFAETGEHLDLVGFTITSTFAAGGSAFCAYWYSSQQWFCVSGSHRRNADPTSGPRQAVFA